MKGWLDNFGKADNANDSNVSLPEGFVGLGYNTKGRNYSPAWGGQFQKGGKLIPVSPMEQITGQTSGVSPTVPYLQTKDPVEFYKSWIQSPEYARRQLLTGYSPSAKDESLAVPSAAASRQTRLESLQNIDPITYSTRQPSESRPGVYGIPSTVNINPLDYIDTNRGMVEAHELAHIAGAMESEGTTRPGVMSAKEQEIFKKSMLPMKEPVLTGAQGSKEREASKRALEDFEHSKKPKELKADLDALRFTMYDKGIYDITKGQKFTEADFEKAKQSLGKDRVFKRLENRVGKKNFVNLMNTIAKADEEELPLAMGGMSIPGSVGFTYARTGSTPSNGKYAKKTMASAQNGITSPLLMMGKILSYMVPEKEASKSIAIEKGAPTKGLTNELLQRQAYKESTFNPSAVSPAGYKGLTQIGEEVIADYSKKKGGKKLDPFNPQDAVELQKFAMDDLYNSSFINKPNQSDSVRIAKTLAAYNWGRGNLYDYLGQQKKKGVDIYNSYDWLKDLPKETSDYVNKILLQQDPSFNKNYTRAITNPKYKSVTSLYGSKEFGGDIPSAQNGGEMQFYQNGLDWKPKSMQDGGKIYEGQELPEFVVEGKDDRLKQAMYEGSNRFLQGALGVMSSPQTGLMEVITGKQQTPSQAFGFQNTDGWLDSPLSFGKNLSNFAMDVVLDPVNLIGVGIADDIARTTLKGLSKKGASRQLSSSVDDASKVFKSEIDWSKWNPETPNYPELINEYNAIEETTKKAGTWMKNPDGSAFEGTPEQFIQQQSSYFKKAYPKGYNEVYRGVSTNNSFANLDEGTDLELSGPRGIFTANKELASNYVLGPQAWEENKRILTPFDPDNTAGLFELVYPKGKQIDRYQQLDDWSNVNLGRIPNKENIKYSIDNLKSQLERRKKITEELESTEGMSSIADQAKIEIKIQENRIAKLQKYYDDFDNIVSDEAEFNKMRNALGDKTTTDDIAQYIPKTNLRSVTLRDLIDSGQGDVTIVNNRPGNYLKSKVGNVGFFDLTNPNIYKGVIPAGIATTLSIDQQKNGGITKDNRGYWNPDNWGKPVEIDSNMITMQGVYEPLLGISDTGDTKLMKPGKNYKFKGKKVTEYPVAELGINQLDAQPMKKLNQLLNFTNNPDKDNWLDKYN